MWVAALCGLAIGIVLNLGADWYSPDGSSPPSRQERGTEHQGANGLPRSWRGWVAGPVSEVAYCSLLLLIATIDLEHRLVPNVLILLGSVLAAGFSLLTRSPSLTMALTGAAAGGGLFLLLALARPNAMGAGDVKLAFLIGMLTGFPWVLQALVLGILLGGLAAALLLLFRVLGPKQYIPYAPYLAAGGIATLLYGQQIAQWYAKLTGLGG